MRNFIIFTLLLIIPYGLFSQEAKSREQEQTVPEENSVIKPPEKTDKLSDKNNDDLNAEKKMLGEVQKMMG